MSKSLCFFAILVLVLPVQLIIQVESVCTNVVASCAEVVCPEQCKIFGRGAKVLGSNCDFYNFCTCTFEHPAPGQPLPACDIGMGLCNDECGNGCCDTKCASKYPKSGVGYCTDFHDVHYCSCTYRRR
ncbi:hypothetical protein P8452_16958 [Trifolium repens]|nr:hypothetical protein P8452_16958 [Trifolium repens]